MCRDKDHGGRRCPADTNAARRKRYQNRKLKQKYKNEELGTPREVNEVSGSSTLEAESVTVNSVLDSFPDIKASVYDLSMAFSRGETVDQSLCEAVVSLGAAIRLVAEREYGAPGDEEIAHFLDEFDKEGAKALKESATNLELSRAEFEEKAAEFRRSAGLPDLGEEVKLIKHYPTLLDWRKKDPATIEALYNEQKDIWNANEELAAKINRERLELRKSFLERRSSAYREAFRKVGVELFDSEESSGLETIRTTKKAKTLTEKALSGTVPVSWIKASNDLSESQGYGLRIWESKRRAHYVNQKSSKRSERAASVSISNRYERDELEWGTPEYYMYTEDPPEGAPSWTKDYVLDSGELFFTELDFYSPYRHRSKDGKPVGNGWKEAILNNGESLYKTYYRVKKRDVAIEFETESEITVPPSGDDYAEAVALHEFSHRTEISIPEVGSIGSAFLRYRARSEESPTRLGEGYRKDEVAYRDNFYNPYMGKYYPGEKNTEIVSMGMESLWSTRQGSFMGDAEDTEYRDFMLGLMAYTG